MKLGNKIKINLQDTDSLSYRQIKSVVEGFEVLLDTNPDKQTIEILLEIIKKLKKELESRMKVC